MKKIFIFLFPSILILGISAGQLLKFKLSDSGGILFLDIVVGLLCLYGLIKLKFKLKNPPNFIVSGLLFFLIGLLSLLSSPLHLSLQEKLISFSYNLRFGIYIFLGWVLFSGGIKTVSEKVSDILIWCGVVLSTAGLWQLIFLPNLSFLTAEGWDPHFFRTVSSFLDPNFLGVFLSLVAPLLILKPKLNYTEKVCFIIIYVAIVTTFSRSGALTFLIIFLLLSILKKSAKFFYLTIFLGLGFLIAFVFYRQFVSFPRNIDRGKSASFRLNSWQEGFQMLTYSPIFGIGFNSYRYALREYHLAPEEKIISHGGSSNDSSLLTVADTTGIVGLTSYLMFLFSIITFAIKNYSLKNGWAIYILASTGGLLINSFFINSLFYPPIMLWLIITSNKLFSD